MQHVGVGPLSAEQEHMAQLASDTSTETNTTSGSSDSSDAMTTQQHHQQQLKAFSGRGHTLAELVSVYKCLCVWSACGSCRSPPPPL